MATQLICDVCGTPLANGKGNRAAHKIRKRLKFFDFQDQESERTVHVEVDVGINAPGKGEICTSCVIRAVVEGEEVEY